MNDLHTFIKYSLRLGVILFFKLEKNKLYENFIDSLDEMISAKHDKNAPGSTITKLNNMPLNPYVRYI